MKLVALIVALSVIGASVSTEELTSSKSDQKIDIKQVELLLQQLESEQAKIKPIVEDDPTVKESLGQLWASFRQVTTAYVNVLNSVNKSLGLPKYPKIPGLTGRRQSKQSIMESTPLKQIAENLSQIGQSVRDVGQLVRRVVVNTAQDGSRTVLDQFKKFTELWSNQLGDVSRNLDNAIQNIQSRQEQQNIFNQILNQIQQVRKNIENYTRDLVQRIRDRINPPPALPSLPQLPQLPSSNSNVV